MSDKLSKSLPDLSQDWPSDPANEDLARLGQDLFASRPELSQLALDRIQIRMRQEMNRPWWQHRWRTLLASFVAAIALSLGIHGWISSSKSHDVLHHSGNEKVEVPPVQDRFNVTLPNTSPKPPDKPAIDLQQYNDLFIRDAKEPKR
jgi:hypothetical protein